MTKQVFGGIKGRKYSRRSVKRIALSVSIVAQRDPSRMNVPQNVDSEGLRNREVPNAVLDPLLTPTLHRRTLRVSLLCCSAVAFSSVKSFASIVDSAIEVAFP